MANTDPSSNAVTSQGDWADAVQGSMVNPVTLLATDYLNHFNEVLMLLQMVPDMPEMIDECVAWRPKSYSQHFLDSGLKEGPLAAEAYEHSPAAYKIPFEAIIKQMDDLISQTTADLQRHIEAGQDMDSARRQSEPSIATLQTLNQLADSIIHGQSSNLDQAKIDDILNA